MMAGDYTIRSHAEIGVLAAQIYNLTRLAFGTYPGVLAPTPAHREWYVRRPGMDAHLSLAALHRGQLVASVFVTVSGVRLGGRLHPMGIVDTVMTHPDHRRRGLARRLLEQAIRGMRARGLAASLLYTIPDSIACRFYQTLGYRPHAPVHYFRRMQQGDVASAPAARRVDAANGERLRAFLNAQFIGHDGYIPVDEDLWRWRRVDRPVELPADTYVVEEKGRLLGSVTMCRAPIVALAHGASCYVLTDLAIAAEAPMRTQAVLASLLCAVPPGAEVLCLSAAANDDDNGRLRAARFEAAAGEVAMLLPFTGEGEVAAAAPPRPWYVLVESVVGV